jgi:8-oxo-dGDP phosphatase
VAEHDFETVSSETIYVGNIFALRADEVRMPGGNVAKREVVENFGAVAILAIDEDNNVVLVYQYRQPLGRRLWELPAGLLDAGGELPHLTAARELAEEVGLSAKDWSVLVDLDTAPGFSDESVRVYRATVLSDIGRPDAHDEEADLVVKWFPLSEAVRMVFNGEIVNSIAVAGILAAYAMPDTDLMRPVDAPWTDRPTSFPRRKEHR